MKLLLTSIAVIVLTINTSFAQTTNELPDFDINHNNYYENLKSYHEYISKYGDSNIKGNKWKYRKLWSEQFQIYPDGSFLSPEEQSMTLKQINKKRNKKESIQSEVGWIPMGPDVVAKSYDTVSAHGIGRVNCIEFHPLDSNIMWIGTPNGGVWKTYNHGGIWMPLGDNLPSVAISSIEVDPNNPDILYLSTGDIETMGYYSNGNAMGIFKSTDGGLTWLETSLSYITPGYGYSYFRKILVNPDSSNNIIAAGSRGIWTSNDYGETWNYILDSLNIVDLDLNLENHNILYACSQYFNPSHSHNSILKSTDFGQNWTILESPIVDSLPIRRTALTISPADENYLYIVAANTRNGLYAIFRSTDAGENWTEIFNPSIGYNLLGWYDGDKSDLRGQGWYDLIIFSDRTDREKLWVGGVNLWGSTDAGESWEIATLWMNTFGSTIHADQHYADYNPVNKNYYICNDGGVFRSKEINLGKKQWITDWIDRASESLKPGCPGFNFGNNWEDISDGLVITEFYRLGLCRDVEGYISGGAQDNSAFYYNGTEWLNYITNYDGMETMIHHSNPDIVYGASQGGRLCKSTDGCLTNDCWYTDTIRVQLGEPGDLVSPYAMDPNDANIIYAGYRNLWQSFDGGESWDKYFNIDSVTDIQANINFFTISRTNSNLLAAAKSCLPPLCSDLSHELWITTNAGESWDLSNTDLPLDSSYLNYIDISGDETQEIHLVFNTAYQNIKVYKSPDLGKSWINITKDLPNLTVYCIVHQDYSEDNIVYVGTNHGVYYTSDSMDTWESYSHLLPNTKVYELEIHYPSRRLYAATYGRGIWQTELADYMTSDINNNYSTSKVEIYPNPNSGEFQIRFEDETLIGEQVQISIIDIFGKVVHSEKKILSNSNISLSNNLSSGAYFLKLESQKIRKVLKLVVER